MTAQTDRVGDEIERRFRLADSIRLRPERDDDVEFSRRLYQSVRRPELAVLGWPEQQLGAFIDQQFDAQRSHYKTYRPAAHFMIIEQATQAIGRWYLQVTPEALRLMEVTLLPTWRGQGIGSRLLRRLLDWGVDSHRPVTLYVEPFNPAHRLYQRLGFEPVDTHGVYHLMRYLPETAVLAASGSSSS